MSEVLLETKAIFKPFSKDFDTQFCYESHGHQEAMARLQLMLEHRYLGVLTGEVGSGKSTLIRKLFAGLDTMSYQSIYLSKAKLTPRDFYGSILSYLGIEAPFSVTKARHIWEEVLQNSIAGADRTLVVVIDEAQELSEAMMMELRFVLSYNMDSCALFPLILVGQPELRKQLRLKKYEATIQRIGLQYHLGGMTKEETYTYIRHHMKASQTEVPVFAESAMQRIHTASQGIPRITNQICTQALLETTNKGAEVIEESHIARILADIERQREGAS
jgi:type II secretory pathway predicted ATPase ExeA